MTRLYSLKCARSAKDSVRVIALSEEILNGKETLDDNLRKEICQWRATSLFEQKIPLRRVIMDVISKGYQGQLQNVPVDLIIFLFKLEMPLTNASASMWIPVLNAYIQDSRIVATEKLLLPCFEECKKLLPKADNVEEKSEVAPVVKPSNNNVLQKKLELQRKRHFAIRIIQIGILLLVIFLANRSKRLQSILFGVSAKLFTAWQLLSQLR